MLRIRHAEATGAGTLRLTLTDGSIIERDVRALLVGPVLSPLRDPALFRRVRVEDGTVTWPNGADLCPDVLIWGGLPPLEVDARPVARRVFSVGGVRS
jgi:hypothetical protein